ncbi:hypothetical protein [Glycomyces sp. NPDC047010]|uniref:hypothetical protein n=1 Tax=Glycomyces sp. NPDC047010 TaxID=3155023 RepID=UPI0033F8FE88
MSTLRLQAALGAAATAAFIGISLITASAPASADGLAVQDTCDRGEACVYEGGALIWSSDSDAPFPTRPFTASGSVRNNGVADPGADHLSYNVIRSDGSNYSQCLNFPGGGTPTTGAVPAGARLAGLRWVGSC